jgi:hypothetical protein
MEAKSPVVGSKEPIFNPAALLAVVPGLAVFAGPLPVSSQAPTRNPVAMVAKLSAKAALILDIDYFHSSNIQESASKIQTRFLA